MIRTAVPIVPLFTALLCVACDPEASLADHDAPQSAEVHDAADPAVRELGVHAYAVRPLARGAEVDLLGPDGLVTGSLTVTGVDDRTPHLDLTWRGQRTTFELDMTRPDAPLTLTVGDETVTVLHDGNDWVADDAQALALLDGAAESWQLARAAFTDAHLDGDLLDYVESTHLDGATNMSMPALDISANRVTASPCPGSQCTQNTCFFWPRLSQWAYVPLTNQCVGTNSCGCGSG